MRRKLDLERLHFLRGRPRALKASQSVWSLWGTTEKFTLALALYQNHLARDCLDGFEPAVNYSVRALARVGERDVKGTVGARFMLTRSAEAFAMMYLTLLLRQFKCCGSLDVHVVMPCDLSIEVA